MKFRFLPGARADLLAARRWYDEQAPGLGQEFGLVVREALTRIVATPLASPAWPGIDASLGRAQEGHAAFSICCRLLSRTRCGHRGRGGPYQS